MDTIRLAARLLRRNPLFSAATILILAVGIGANTAMFSIVSGVLLRPLPFAHPDRLVLVAESKPDAQGGSRASLATLLAWRDGQTAVDLTAYFESSFTLTEGEPVVVNGTAVAANFFPFLGEPLLLGRSFADTDDRPGAPGTVILGHALWQRRFAGDASVVGRTLTIEDQTYEVIGVARPGFDYPAGGEYWTTIRPLVPDGYERIPQAKFARVLGRLGPAISRERAEAQLSAIAGAIPANEGWSARVTPLREYMTGEVSTPLFILMAAVLFVLLIACLNVGNLLLARAAARGNELAIRAALGAGRARIARELLVESLLLSGAAGMLGVLGAVWGLDLLVRMSPTELPRVAEVSIDARVLGFTVLISLATGLLAGLLPVVRAPRDLTPALKESSRQATASRSGQRVRAALVVAEVALSVVLLVGAGLLVRSFLTITSVDPGFRPERVTTFDLTLTGPRYGTLETIAFYEQVVERIEAVPGVTAAAFTHNLPISGRNMVGPARVEYREPVPGAPPAHVSFITPGFFRTMGIPLQRGRDFETADTNRGLVAIVHETFARTFFPGEDPVGKRARTLFGPPGWREIVGVVADVHQIGLTKTPEPVFYTLVTQDLAKASTLVVRSALPAAATIAATRAVLRDLDPELPFAAVATMQDLIDRSVAQPRFYATVLGTFATLAGLLALLGLYAVLSQTVVQRQREIGIRMALGARAADIVRLTLRQGTHLTLLGAGLGVLGAWALTRVLASLLFRVQPADPLTFAATTSLLLAAALLAMLLPARRAARIDPLRSLRQ